MPATVAFVADEIFKNPRLAAIYDAFDGERSDLTFYLQIVQEHGATDVLDIGCGTGSLAVLLAELGIKVVGVDPATASLDVARTKPNAEHVNWIHGYAIDVPTRLFDFATMTGNVAQAIIEPAEWLSTLATVHSRLHRGGYLVFESRDPAQRAWEHWNKRESHCIVDVEGIGPIESWVDLLNVDGALVTFRWTYIFPDGETCTSDSTLRFRSREELTQSLEDSGFAITNIFDTPDRHGAEFVFFAQRP